VQGGVRARMFFGKDPRRAPTLNKTPLVRWDRRYAYVSSTHSLLPRRLNHVYDTTGGEKLSGILLHTKFLHTIVEKSRGCPISSIITAASGSITSWSSTMPATTAPPITWPPNPTYRSGPPGRATGCRASGSIG
jgi:hypothetical protein